MFLTLDLSRAIENKWNDHTRICLTLMELAGFNFPVPDDSSSLGMTASLELPLLFFLPAMVVVDDMFPAIKIGGVDSLSGGFSINPARDLGLDFTI